MTSESTATKKDILFVSNSQEYFRNYILSGALSKIKNRCFFLVDEKLSKEKVPETGTASLIYYSYPDKKVKLHWHLFNINTKKFIGKSETFKFRFARLNKQMQRIYSGAAFPIFYNVIKMIILWRANDSRLVKIIKTLKPALILLPSSGYEGETFEIIKIARDEKITTLMLVDNWDNLCSKTILTRKPDYLAVWGRQSVEMAQRIHNFDKDKIFIMGSPRFISYFNSKGKNFESQYPFKYALFAGNALAFDELTALKKLDEIIERNKINLTIIYRPHPWRHPRKCPDTFFEYDFKHIKLDEQAKEYYKKERGDNFAPSLDYYPRLLANMEFMICPLSTMLIEGLLVDKPVFVLTYDDGIHFTNPKNAFKSYEHFRSIEKLSHIKIIREFKNLKEVFGKIKDNKTKGKFSDIDYYISSLTADYPNRLKQVADEIIK